MQRVYIVAGKRTPVGAFLGGLSSLRGPELGAIATRATVKSVDLDPAQVDEVILGNVIQVGQGQNPARQVSLGAGLDKATPCNLVNKVCASGMKAVMLASQSIQLGYNKTVLAGGFESMSNAPFYLPNYRAGQKFGNSKIMDALSMDGLTDAYEGCAMGVCAEKTAEDFGITRELQDAFAIRSYEKAREAADMGRFAQEIFAVTTKKGLIQDDEEPLKFNRDKIPQLRPVFKQDGTVTAANASKLNDGACSLLLMGEHKMQELGLTPLAEVVSYADAEVDPMDFNISPAEAARLAAKRAGIQISDIDYFEFNEAFSVTGLACAKLLDLQESQVNVNGGAVALGHPIGMSGARIILSLATVLKQNSGTYGLASLCNGGGGSSAVVIRRV